MSMRNAACALCLIFPMSCPCQTALSKAFADIQSRDPATAEAAKSGIVQVMEKEMPTIEQDTALLCGALHSSDPYVRLQGAGVLATIVLAAPMHNRVVVSCFPDLITAAADSDDDVRNDALVALALNSAGSPPQAHDVFARAFTSTNYRTVELGAIGLLKEDGGHRTANRTLVEDALLATPDSRVKLNLLSAIRGSGVTSDALFESSRKFLSDPAPEIQIAAIKAMATTSTDKSQAVSVIKNFANTSSISLEVKRQAQGVINQLEAAH
jgi:hypothetical protein